MGKRLDEVSKSLARGVSRTQVLKGAVGGFAAAALGSVLPGRTALADGGNFATLTCCEAYCIIEGGLYFNSTFTGIKQCVQACLQAATYHGGPCGMCDQCASGSICLPQLGIGINSTPITLNQTQICIPLDR